MVELPRGKVFSERGVWEPRRIHVSTTEPLLESAHVSCPGCGEAASLRDHAIAADGTVTPSLVCPTRVCGFHEWVKLLGWAERNQEIAG